MSHPLVKAAQYLRMSTDHQQYSLDNQKEAISRYAAENGFVIMKTYSDAAKSGLHLTNRTGLKQLLRDVMDGAQEFRAVLVYDVSRWGRFQDADEAAHYEYLCKSSGVPVHYCAETFVNDNSTVGLIMKALKRTMAGEYSRDLSAKVWAGQARLARMGFRVGGVPAFGLRRLLIDSTRKPKQLLTAGEYKNISTDRVILVSGLSGEVATVRRIFHEFVNEHRSMRSIANRLNREGAFFLGGVEWNANHIARVLRQENYVGKQVWARTASHLGSPVRRRPSNEWVTCDCAFEPIISSKLFAQAQAALANLTCHLSNEDLLDRLRALLKSHGRLTSEIIHKSKECPGLTTYHKRLGGLLNAYKQLGYMRPDLLSAATNRQRLMLLRAQLIDALVEQSKGQLAKTRPSARFRTLLKFRRTGLLISVVLARHVPTRKGLPRWLVEPPRNERKRTTIVAFLCENNCSIHHMRVFPRIIYPSATIRTMVDDVWMKTGLRLESLPDAVSKILSVRLRKPPS